MAIINNNDEARCDACGTPWSTMNNVFYETYDKGVICQHCKDAGVSTKIVERSDDTGGFLS